MNGLPVQLTSFVGREVELDAVSEAVTQTRLLTLTGPGGCGKTRLAGEVAAGALGRFADGGWWVDLAPLPGSASVARALALALEVRPLPGRDDLHAGLFFLESRAALVVLDNCEHLLEQCAAVAQAILEACPRATVLATSREPLRVAGETDWQVPSLSVPAEGASSVAALAGSDAVELFVERARKVRPGFALGGAVAAPVAGICRELDGMPLAVELAAARLRVLSVEQIAAGLGDRFRLLGAGPRGAPDRHQTLRASVDWSHDLLPDDERVLLRRLAVFAGDFTLQAAERVAGHAGLHREQILDLLASLAEKSLIQADEGRAVRYRLLETVRQYALERLELAGEADRVRDRHRDAYLELAAKLDAQFFSPRQGEATAALDADAANLASATARATATAPDKALDLCAALFNWWRSRGMFADGEAACADALSAAAATPSAARTRVLGVHAHLLMTMGAHDRAAGLAGEALAAAEVAGERSAAARALNVLARLSLQADHLAARGAAARGATLAREAGDGWAWRYNTWIQGLVALLQENGPEARPVFDELRREAARACDREVVALASLGLGATWYAAGDHAQARTLIEAALADSRELGEMLAEVVSVAHLALLDAQAGTAGAALEGLRTTRERALHAGAALTLPWLELATSVASASVGMLSEAGERLRAVVDRPFASLQARSWAAVELAEVGRLAGDASSATTHAELALELAAAQGNPWLQARAQAALGRLSAASGRWREADGLHHQALDAISEGAFLLELPGALEGLAGVAAGLESRAEAGRLLGAAGRARRELGFVAWKHQHAELLTLTAQVREALGAGAFDEAFAAGDALAREEAVAWVRRARGSRKRPAFGWEGLTPTELDVVRHAARGLTNAETGARMFIAPGTVKAHLSHIYTKLGVRNRAELARQAAQRLPAQPS